MSRRYRIRDDKVCYKTPDAPYTKSLNTLADFNESACVFLMVQYILKYHNLDLNIHQREGFRYSIHIPEDDFIKLINNIFPEIEYDKNTVKYIYKTDKETLITRINGILVTLRLSQGIFTKEYAVEKFTLFKICGLI